MKKIYFFLVINMLIIGSAYTQTTYPGYLNTIYGTIVTEAYGECIHTAYFDKEANAVPQCHENESRD